MKREIPLSQRLQQVGIMQCLCEHRRKCNEGVAGLILQEAAKIQQMCCRGKRLQNLEPERVKLGEAKMREMDKGEHDEARYHLGMPGEIGSEREKKARLRLQQEQQLGVLLIQDDIQLIGIKMRARELIT